MPEGASMTILTRVPTIAPTLATASPSRFPTAAPSSPVPGATLETWLTVPGDTIADLMAGTNNLVNTPNQKVLLSGSSLLEVPPNADGSWGEEYYGVRISGWLVPETTGTYKFWIAADDVGELWLSTNGNPVNKELICQCSTFVGFREWDIDPEQASMDIALVAGEAYYYEVRIHRGCWCCCCCRVEKNRWEAYIVNINLFHWFSLQ